MIGSLRLRLSHGRLMRIRRGVGIRGGVAVLLYVLGRVELAIQALDLILQTLDSIVHGLEFAAECKPSCLTCAAFLYVLGVSEACATAIGSVDTW